MTLPTTYPINGTDDDSDMFGPPRSSPPIGYHHHRSKVPMISPKLRQREERKRILQLCAHKLERIKDSEANLRRSVCINNTYSRLTDELRREKQSRYLANLPKSETKPEAAHNSTFNSYKCSSNLPSTNNNNQINSNHSCSANNNYNSNNLQHQNDPMEMYPSSTIQNYHNLHYQQQQYHQSSISNQTSTTCITTSVHSAAKPTIPCINANNNIISNFNSNKSVNCNNSSNDNSDDGNILINNKNIDNSTSNRESNGENIDNTNTNISSNNNNKINENSADCRDIVNNSDKNISNTVNDNNKCIENKNYSNIHSISHTDSKTEDFKILSTSLPSCQFYSNNNSIAKASSPSAVLSTPNDCALISSYSQTSTISTPTTAFTCNSSTTITNAKENSTSMILPICSKLLAPSSSISTSLPQAATSILETSSTTRNNNGNVNNNNNNKFLSSCQSTNSVDTDLEILDRELSAIDATMPLTDPEITQGVEHLEKAVSSRKRLRSEDDNDRFVREALSHFYLPTTVTTTAQKLISTVIDDCPLDLKRPKLSLSSTSTLSPPSISSIYGFGAIGNANISSITGNCFNYGIGIGLGFNVCNSIVSNSYAIGCCSQVVASSIMSAAAATTNGSIISSNNFNNNSNNINTNNNLITNDLDLELALDLNSPNQKEFEVIMDALRLGTPSPTPSCGSDSCGQAAMMSETGSCNPNGIFNNLVVTSLET
ncbi:putative uncharacterized protein DDB_G0282133 [Condylostylus longicornis]|uniref:putative uncharacterized protein DDB_G0282133 n=1 Tax=Condylostylus longicornis TaxID=2530218 RepID=UPI00244DE6AA|nr:putative uncharacterized protein DDB_G0282133 [Condylostylus longicornis]XP_055374762.1 putative uncharacterized protein DDB_G0282133 [Condylostylus longicornis]XP_055374763.1 putative uncharacterized protein DDB_G0282133 [Condylostylus longicornis]